MFERESLLTVPKANALPLRVACEKAILAGGEKLWHRLHTLSEPADAASGFINEKSHECEVCLCDWWLYPGCVCV